MLSGLRMQAWVSPTACAVVIGAFDFRIVRSGRGKTAETHRMSCARSPPSALYPWKRYCPHPAGPRRGLQAAAWFSAAAVAWDRGDGLAAGARFPPLVRGGADAPPRVGNQAAMVSTRSIAILRGFRASGTSRTRSTWSSPFSMDALTTFTFASSSKRFWNERSAIPR